MSSNHWYYERNQLINTPSRKHGISEEKEQSYLQQTANLIQEMGRKLKLPLICINTAVLFTQRFYVYHPLTYFEKFSLGASALFLAAKVEETPRKVEHVCQIAKLLGIVRKGVNDAEYAQEIIINENILLETLGFELLVQHPHQHVLRLCNLLQASKTLSQTSYIFATYCLHLTRMCLVHKPVIIACLCIYMACKLTNWAIPLSREGKYWYTYGDPDITEESLESMYNEFVDILKQCPENFKRKTLTASHENLIKKLFVHTTGLPIVKDADQFDYASDATSNSPKSAPESDIKMDTSNENVVPIPPEKPADPIQPKLPKHAHSNSSNKHLISSSSSSSSITLPKPPTHSNKSAFSSSSSHKTERSSELAKQKMHYERNLSHTSSSSSQHRKPPEQIVPPLKLGISKLVQNNYKEPPAPLKVTTSSSSKPVHSIKVTIPKSRFMIPKLPTAAQGDVKSDKMSFSFFPSYLGDNVGHNSSKKFKPN